MTVSVKKSDCLCSQNYESQRYLSKRFVMEGDR